MIPLLFGIVVLLLGLTLGGNQANAACASTNECSSKIIGYAVLQDVGINASKINGYAVLQDVGINASKINGYAVLCCAGLAASKVNGYAVLTPGSALSSGGRARRGVGQ